MWHCIASLLTSGTIRVYGPVLNHSHTSAPAREPFACVTALETMYVQSPKVITRR